MGKRGQWAADSEVISDEQEAAHRHDDVELGGHGIQILRWSELDREEQKVCKKLFKDRIFPVLTPLAGDKGLHCAP